MVLILRMLAISLLIYFVMRFLIAKLNAVLYSPRDTRKPGFTGEIIDITAEVVPDKPQDQETNK